MGHTRYQKKRNFALISKMCRSLEFGKREKICNRKTEFLGTWKILQNIVFLRKNHWKLLDARVLQRKILLLLVPFAPIFEEIFFQLFRDGAVLLEVKRSNKIETVQYFKKRFFIILS
jgi:hypothetical protein